MKLTKLEKKEIAERALKFITDNPENATRLQFIYNVVEWAEKEALTKLELKYNKKYLTSYKEQLDKEYKFRSETLHDQILETVDEEIKSCIASLHSDRYLKDKERRLIECAQELEEERLELYRLRYHSGGESQW